MPRAIIPSYDPQDRLERLGPMAVKDAELLGTILGKPDRAELILSDYPKESLVDMSLEQLLKIEGLSKTKAKTLLAAFELARRSLHKGLGVRPVISAPGDSLHYLTDIKDQPREHFVCLYLNARNQVIRKEVVSIGSLSSAIVHPREVFGLAVALPVASVISGAQSPVRRRIAQPGRPQPDASAGAGG